MKLSVYNENLDRTAIVDERFVSCLWSESYCDVGSFALELQATDKYKQLLRPGCFVGRQDRKTLMLVDTVEIGANTVAVKGKTALQLLQNSVFIGTIPAGTRVAQAVKDAYNGSTRIPLLSVAESELPDTYTEEISNMDLLELAETMCRAADIGMRVVRQNKALSLELYKPPINAQARFSERFGNLNNLSLLLSTSKYKNYCIVLGADGARWDIDATNGEPRRELLVDQSGSNIKSDETEAQYRDRLVAKGVEKLAKQKKTWKCDFAPSGAGFGTRFDLGDIAVVLLPEYNIRLQARITKFSEKAQKNGTELTIDVGELTVI